MKKTTILIPARMASRRFPGKPLALINGIPMVVYCAKNAIKTGLEVIVCTDSKEIMSVCSSYDINSILTPEFNTGTDRIAHVAESLYTENIINLQGDEPLITSKSINRMAEKLNSLEKESSEIISGISFLNPQLASDSNIVKCAIIDRYSIIQYFSRKPLLNNSNADNNSIYIKQLGLYGMAKKNLREFSSLPQGNLEKAENVELLRWIENKKLVTSCFVTENTVSVDTPEDLKVVLEILKSKRI